MKVRMWEGGGRVRRLELEELRVIAARRLFLDNFDHLTAEWISGGRFELRDGNGC